MYLLGIQDTVCHEHLLGECHVMMMPFHCDSIEHFLCSSAEAVAQMMIADMEGKEWEVPDWFPRSYLM